MISKKASGEVMTTATWIRQFVTSHPRYKKDSVVSQEIAYDLMRAALAVSDGTSFPPELLGGLGSPLEDEDAIDFAKESDAHLAKTQCS